MKGPDMADKKATRSVKEIEADLTANRERLARNVDELVFRVSPAELKRRGIAAVKAKIDDTIYDDQGAPRYDLLAVGLAGVAGVTLVLGGARRAFYRG